MTVQEVSRVVEFIESVCAAAAGTDGPERRTEARRALAMVIDVLPLDDRMVPCGSRRTAIVRDLSEHGIGLFGDVPVETRFLRVWLPIGASDHVAALVEVLRCERFAFLFNIGGRFVETDEGIDSLPMPTAG